MPVEVRVMCGACGRPQRPGLRCVFCGGPLPSSPISPGRAVADGVELRGGDGVRYRFTAELLELLTPRGGPGQVPLVSVKGARLERRPVFQLWPAVMLAFLSGWLVQPLWARGLALGVFAALAGLVLRSVRAVVVLFLLDGRRLTLPLGTLVRGLPGWQARAATWELLLKGLRERGVPVERRTKPVYKA